MSYDLLISHTGTYFVSKIDNIQIKKNYNDCDWFVASLGLVM